MENRHYPLGGGRHVPPPADPAPPVSVPQPFLVRIPGGLNHDVPPSMALDATGTVTPVTPSGPGPVTPTMHISAPDTELPWIPSYQYNTGYGERFKAFAKTRKGDSVTATMAAYQLLGGRRSESSDEEVESNSSDSGNGDEEEAEADADANSDGGEAEGQSESRSHSHSHRNQRTQGSQSHRSAYSNTRATPLTSIPPIDDSDNESADDRLDLSIGNHTLPQLYPSRRAGQLDGVGLWNEVSPPKTSWARKNVPGASKLLKHRGDATGAGDADLAPRTELGVPPLPTGWARPEPSAAAVTLSHAETQVGVEHEHETSTTTTTTTAATTPPSKTAVALRSNYPIPQLCGIYYYEITIVIQTNSGLVSLGLCDESSNMAAMPGLEPRSWGFHSDDGRIVASQGTPKEYGPPYQRKDVVGCGINFRRNEVFFTKNGVSLGLAFQDVVGVLYPCVGLRPGCVVRANFGQDPFAFDIDQYTHLEKARTLDDVLQARVPDGASGLDADQLVHNIVASYLSHMGYVDTVQALARDSAQTDGLDLDPDTDMDPGVQKDENDENDENAQEIKCRLQIRDRILGRDIDGATELLRAHYPSVLAGQSIMQFKLDCRRFVELVHRSLQDPTQTAQVLQYGAELRAKYKDDSRAAVAPTLDRVFGLLAYDDPSVDPDMAYMLDAASLKPLADELNSAMLQDRGRPSVPSLLRLAQHTTQLVWELADEVGPSHPSAALINVKDDFLA